MLVFRSRESKSCLSSIVCRLDSVCPGTGDKIFNRRPVSSDTVALTIPHAVPLFMRFSEVEQQIADPTWIVVHCRCDSVTWSWFGFEPITTIVTGESEADAAPYDSRKMTMNLCSLWYGCWGWLVDVFTVPPVGVGVGDWVERRRTLYPACTVFAVASWWLGQSQDSRFCIWSRRTSLSCSTQWQVRLAKHVSFYLSGRCWGLGRRVGTDVVIWRLVFGIGVWIALVGGDLVIWMICSWGSQR